MRRHARVALTTTLLFTALASVAGAVEIAKLGHFEDQAFGPWAVSQLTAGGTAGWFISDDGTYSPINSAPAYSPSGNWQAVADCDGAYGTGILHRLVTIPGNADTLKLRFWYRSTFVGDVADLSPGGQAQGARVDVMTSVAAVTGMGGVLHTLFATSYPANADDDAAPRTLALGVQALRGQTVRLRIAAVSNTAPMIVGVDDVRLEGSQYEALTNIGLPQLRDGAADWGDFDGDGDLDVAIEGHDGTTRHAGIYRNDGATFTLFASAPDGFQSGDVRWVDTDRDGDLDVFFNGTRAAGPWSWIGRNTGAGFSWGLVQFNMTNCNLAMADFDADGDQDLLGSYGGRIDLYRNHGAGGFTDVSSATATGMDSSQVYFYNSTVYPNFAAEGRPVAGSNGWNNFRNDGQGAGFTRLSTGVADVAGVHVETGSALGGANLTFLSGRRLNSTPLLIGAVTTSTGASLIEDVPGLHDATAAWGDDDLDGLPDLFVAGNANGTPHVRLHRHTGTSLQATSDVFELVTEAACAMGDYDDDGDLDLLLLGQGSGGPATTLYRNWLTTPNVAPSTPPLPPGYSLQPGEAGIVLLANPAYSDDHTSAVWGTFNFRAGSTPGATDVISPDSDPVTGARRVARAGNSRGAASYELSAAVRKSHHRPIYFAVQAVDQQFKGSAWSPELLIDFGPRVLSVTDVPGDQGGSVRVTIAASPYDVAYSAHPAAAYNVFGRVSSTTLATQVACAAALAREAAPPEDGAVATVSLGDRRFVAPAAAQAAGFPDGTWEIVASFAAYQASQYTVRVPTLADSGSSGPNWSVFIASVHSDSAGWWWMSNPDSGKSLDNIAPGAPQGVQLSYHPGTHNALSWQPSAAEDFQYFRIYRGTTPSFAIGAATLVGSTADVSWTDPAVGTTGAYYKLTALDHAGNESAAASPSVTTDVAGGATPVYAFALAAPSPSPFAARTSLSFTLPVAQHARLEVFDAAGRRVAKLADGAFAAGPHSLTWDGATDDGTRANAGLLFVRLSSGGREAVRRVVMLGSAK